MDPHSEIADPDPYADQSCCLVIEFSGMAQGPGNLEKVPEEILALFPGDSRSFFPEKPIKFQN